MQKWFHVKCNKEPENCIPGSFITSYSFWTNSHRIQSLNINGRRQRYRSLPDIQQNLGCQSKRL